MMIRPYVKSDSPELVNLVKLNSPEYFHPSEIQDLQNYLEEDREDYFVGISDGKIIAGAGINYLNDKLEARLSWDFVHPEYHGNGWGSKLMEHRLTHIRLKKRFDTLTVRTSQHAYRFYQNFGFELNRTEKDFWAKGFDLYEMAMPL